MAALVKTGARIRDVASYLPRFDAHPSPTSAKENGRASIVESQLEEETQEVPPTPQPPPARDEIHAECEAKFASALEAERIKFEECLRNERERWTREQAERLSALLTRELSSGFENLRGDAARILSPFVSQETTARVLKDLIAALRAGVANVDAPAVEIQGPKDFLEKIQMALAGENIALALRECDEVDARATFAATTIETALDEFIGRLSNERGKKT